LLYDKSFALLYIFGYEFKYYFGIVVIFAVRLSRLKTPATGKICLVCTAIHIVGKSIALCFADGITVLYCAKISSNHVSDQFGAHDIAGDAAIFYYAIVFSKKPPT